MFLRINNTDNVVLGASTTTPNTSANWTIIQIADIDYQDDMVGSIYTDEQNYLPRPTESYYVASGSPLNWVDSRTDQEVWDTVRLDRDYQLGRCDWTQINSNALTAQQVTDWATWRTDLRDVPQDNPVPQDAETALEVLLANKP